MAKQSLIQKEKKRQRLKVKYQEKRNVIKKEIYKAKTLSRKLYLSGLMKKLPRDSSPTRCRNRCWVTGRSRGFYRDFGLSRHVLREMGSSGMIPGLQKASW
jgi:small subunit ribosomal protein S14